MNQSISLGYLLKQRKTTQPRALKSALELCRDAGFTVFDYTPDYRSDDYLQKARQDRELMDAMGMRVEQTHTPFNRYNRYPADAFPVLTQRSLEVSAAIGAKYVVIHGDEYRTSDHYDEKEILNWTYDYLAPHVEYAEKHGMVVAIENLFEDVVATSPQFDGKSRFTARVDELQAIIEKFNTPSVRCCWDFGHGKCSYGAENQLEALKQVGKYVRCTHVHDNYYGKDLHLMPFLGDIDWESHMAYLKEIGYQGMLSYEFGYGCLPDALLPVWLNSVHAVGEYLIGLYDNA